MIEDRIYGLLGSYMKAPQWIKRVVGGSYRALPLSLRYGVAHAKFAEEAVLADARQVESVARAKLDATLRHAAMSVPAYAGQRTLWNSDMPVEERLRHFPTVRKADIKADLSRFVSTAVSARELLPMYTGGSTSEPMHFYLERGITRPKEAAYIRAFQALAGAGEADRILSLRGRTVVGAEHGERLWMIEPIKNQLILSSDHLEARWMPGYVEALRRFRPRLIEAFPSALYPLARWLEANPLPEFTRQVTGVLLYSENVFDYQIDLFRRVFPCPVLKHYGHSERVVMATSTPGDDRYSFWPLYGHLELLDPSGRPVTREGEIGEIVGTSFDNRAMPFVRYRTGDFAILDTQAGADAHPVCRSIEGRMQEFVVCRDRRLVSITTLGAAHFDSISKARAIQYEQHEAGKLILKLVLDDALTPELEAEVSAAVAQKTQGGCEVTVVRVDDIVRTHARKQPLILQSLDLSAFFGSAVRQAAAGRCMGQV